MSAKEEIRRADSMGRRRNHIGCEHGGKSNEKEEYTYRRGGDLDSWEFPLRIKRKTIPMKVFIVWEIYLQLAFSKPHAKRFL